MAKERLSASKRPARSRTPDKLSTLVLDDHVTTKRLNANIPEEMHAAFKQRTALERVSMGKKLEQLIEEYLRT